MAQNSLLDVKKAAVRMGISFQLLEAGLIQGLFPFGVAVKGENSYRYIIVKARFEAWMTAQDLGHSALSAAAAQSRYSAESSC